MEFNWGDPKKNSLLSSRMMAKAEVTRKKRLTSVKSTLSNQLHPATENKLRKKKRAPDSARHVSCEDDNHQNNCNNNDSHELHSQDSGRIKSVPQLPSDDESCCLDTIRHDAFPVPSLSSCPNNISMFDEFSLNAAADGLFHPASTIEAFTEHDAKYRQVIQGTSEKPRSGPLRARSGSEYPPSRENHRLPSIPSGRTKRDRLSTRPEPKLQPAGNSGSAPASMTTTSSLSKLLDVDETKRSMSATQSDSNLYAPRRLDIVPSSADRNALDFLEHELGSDNNSPHQSPVASSPQVTRELGNNEVLDGGDPVVPPLNFSLAKKFEELKRIMKSNREKQDSDRQHNEQQPAEQVAGAGSKSSDRSDQGKKSAIRAASSGLSDTKKAGEASSNEKGPLKKRPTPAARTSTDMNSGSSSSKRVMGNQVSGTASRKASSRTAIVRAPPRAKKEMIVHSGVSLSDLKAEHREALQMLKELGGPVDPDYQLADLDAPVSSKSYRVGRTDTKMSGSGLSLAGGIIHTKPSNQTQARNSTTTPPTSASSSVSIVTKLRESISSGRISSREASPRTSSSDENVGSGRMVHEGEACNTQEKTRGSDAALSSSNQTPAKDITSNVAVALAEAQVTERSGADPSSLSPPVVTPNTDTADPWKQYDDDDAELDDGDEDNNYEMEHEGSSGVKGASNTDRSGDRYSDEDFESDW
ncbi:hypothetical protein PRIC2_013521 [Phytophthora ramorum]